MIRRRLTALVLGAVTVLSGTPASAGGYDELPVQGAQALGRGGAFTAKADDASALFYNVAGFAKQRGTKLYISTNLQMDSFSFARAGNYPDDPNDPATPWGGRPFPVVQNANGPTPLPMLVLSTDLGLFDRLTFAAGLLVPSAVGRTFPLGTQASPSPARYDAVTGGGIIAYPTLGAAYRLTDDIDVGVAGHLVYASIEDPLAIEYVDPGGGACKNAEYYGCDAQGGLKASGMGVAASAGVLFRPASSVELGAQLKTPWTVKADGATTIKVGGSPLPPSSSTVSLSFPLSARIGARYVGRRSEKNTELYDVELDGTYDPWSSTNPGPIAVTTNPTNNQPTTVPILHNYKDTFGVHLGGGYNIDVGDDVLSLRAGAFYLSPSTDSAYTRVDINTLPKISGTLGVGYSWGPVSVHAGYAGVASVSRTVTDGELRPANQGKGGAQVDGNGKPLAAVNNGVYSGFTHVLSISVELSFTKLFEKRPSPTPAEPSDEDAARHHATPVADSPPSEREPAAPAPPPVAVTSASPEPPEPPYWEAADSEMSTLSPPPPAPKGKRRGKPRVKAMRRSDAASDRPR